MKTGKPQSRRVKHTRFGGTGTTPDRVPLVTSQRGKLCAKSTRFSVPCTEEEDKQPPGSIERLLAEVSATSVTSQKASSHFSPHFPKKDKLFQDPNVGEVNVA